MYGWQLANPEIPLVGHILCIKTQNETLAVAIGIMLKTIYKAKIRKLIVRLRLIVLFWPMVIARRKSSANRTGSEVIFYGKNVNTSAEITTEWGQYFMDLYSPTNNDHFDISFETAGFRKIEPNR